MNGCILLFGLPRSGTTWIGKLFDSHPDTLYRHEPDSVQRLAMPLFPPVEAASRHRSELERFVASLPRMRSPEVVGKQPLFAKSYLSTASLFAYRASVLAAKAASKTRRHVPCPYRPTGGNHGDVVHVVWKSIESLGRLGVCAKAMPDARVIHLTGLRRSSSQWSPLSRFFESTPPKKWSFRPTRTSAPAERFAGSDSIDVHVSLVVS